MDLLGGPAALGGIIACIALAAWTLGAWTLGAWTLGRWHGGALAANPANGSAHCQAPGPTPTGQHPPFEWHVTDPGDSGSAAPFQHSQRAGREVWFENAFSVGELHAEVSDYRRQQKVFAAGTGNALYFALSPTGASSECRDHGRIGQPACAMPSEMTGAMTSAGLPVCGNDCTATANAAVTAQMEERAIQPSAPASPLTRE